jgi:hypothetical protein
MTSSDPDTGRGHVLIGTPAGAARPTGGGPLRPGGRGPARRQLQTTGAGYVGYSTPETCCTTRMTWHE